MRWLLITALLASLFLAAPVASIKGSEGVEVIVVPYLGGGILYFDATIISDTEVSLSWLKGESVVNVMVKAKYGSMPMSRSEGYLVYEGELNFASDTSVNFDEIPSLLYYRIWAQNDEGVWLDNQVNTEGLEGFIVTIIAMAFLVMSMVFLALWRRELFLYIIAMAALIFFSLQLVEVSVPMTIPIWVLALYMMFKSVTYFVERR